MPELKNARHERFCQERAKGKSITAAYEEAGYRPSGSNSHRLSENEGIRQRIAEILSAAARKTVATVADIAAQLDEDREFARARDHSAAAVSATMGKAKVLGLIVEKHKVGIKSIDDMTEDELRQFLGDGDAGA